MTYLSLTGLTINIIGTLFIAFAFGNVDSGSSDSDGIKDYPFVVVKHPRGFWLGIVLLILGFVLQIPPLFF